MMGAIYKTNFNFTKIGVMTLNSYFSAKTNKKHKVTQIAKRAWNECEKWSIKNGNKSREDDKLKTGEEAVHENKLLTFRILFFLN